MAVLMVLCHHSVSYVKAPFYFEKSKDLAEFGWTGVQLFFILSAYTLRRSWEWRKNSESWPVLRFYIRRAFRILPFWWCNLIYFCFRQHPQLIPFVANLTLVFGFFAKTYSWVLVPYGWSLSVEETFYWLFPLWVKRLGSVRSIFAALLCAISVAWVWDNWAPVYLEQIQNHEFYFGFPLSRYYIFFIGFLTYALTERFGFKAFIEQISKGKIPWLDLGFAFLAFEWAGYGQFYATFLVWMMLLLSLSPHTWVGRMARSRLLGKVGIVCYSMYLLHFHVLNALVPFQDRLFRALSVPPIAEAQLAVVVPLSAVLTFAMSLITYHLIELPSVKLGRRVLASKFFNQRFKEAPITQMPETSVAL